MHPSDASSVHFRSCSLNEPTFVFRSFQVVFVEPALTTMATTASVSGSDDGDEDGDDEEQSADVSACRASNLRGLGAVKTR